MVNLTEIIFEIIPGKNGDIGLIILNRPQALNATNLTMLMALHQQLKAWELNPSIKAVIIKSNSDKAFCAGGDIREIYERKQLTGNPFFEFFWHEYRLNYYIAHYPKPYIALMDGITMGGGAGISVHGRYRVATERTLFAMPETAIGFFPDIGGSYFLSRCPGQTGMYLALTGARIRAADTQYLGLTDYYINSAKLSELTQALVMCADITSFPNIFKQYCSLTKPSNLEKYKQLIDEIFCLNSIEEIITALSKHDDAWCNEVLTTISSKSPTSLKVTLEQLNRGATLDLAECLKMEYRIVSHMLTMHDFYEGVRAVIIEKDNKPEWQPNNLQQISSYNIKQYFKPVNNAKELNFD